MKTIAIIGSGVAGLSLGIRLQARGFQVQIFEKNEQVGGHAYPFNEKGYTFDMGPTLITAPEMIRDLYKAAGRNMGDYLDLIALDPFYRIYFHDGRHLDYTSDQEKMKQQLAQFDTRDAKAYDKYMRT